MKYKDSNGQWQTIKVKNYGIEQTPIGSMIYYPSLDIPDGYLVCDGSEKLIADYPLLFNAIGYIGGEDVDTGYFRLPDMRGVVPGGFNPNLVGTTNPLAGNFGDLVGSPTHTHTQGKTGSTALTINQIPSHSHTWLSIPTTDTQPWEAPNQVFEYKYVAGTHYTANTTSTGGGQGHTHTNPTTNSSSSVQPTKLYHWLIKAKNIITLGGYTEDFEIRGNLKFLSNRFFSGKGQYDIDLNNSDIINANAIYFNDSTDSGDEGFNFLKSGASPKSDNPDDYDNLRVLDNSLILNNVKVVENGSNSNGSWTKWSDGTMICRKNIDYGNLSITTQWGSFYETSSKLSLRRLCSAIYRGTSNFCNAYKYFLC